MWPRSDKRNLGVEREEVRMKESAHQGKPEERSRRLGDNGVIGTGKDVIVTGELPCL